MSSELVPTGLDYDRQLVLVDGNDDFVSQRQEPKLAAVEVRIVDASLSVIIPRIGQTSFELEDYDLAAARPISIFEKMGSGAPQSTEASQLFSDYLGYSVELLHNVEPRPIREDCSVDGASSSSAFADGYPLLITAIASLRTVQAIEPSVTMDRFRPNIVIEGDMAAYSEDYWRKIRIGSLQALVVRACARCAIPNVDQSTGIKAKGSPVTRALSKERNGYDHIGGGRGLFFGQNLIHDLGFVGSIKIGDSVVIESQSDQPNIDLIEPS